MFPGWYFVKIIVTLSSYALFFSFFCFMLFEYGPFGPHLHKFFYLSLPLFWLFLIFPRENALFPLSIVKLLVNRRQEKLNLTMSTSNWLKFSPFLFHEGTKTSPHDVSRIVFQSFELHFINMNITSLLYIYSFYSQFSFVK